MKVIFKQKELKKIFSQTDIIKIERKLQKVYGQQITKTLIKRINHFNALEDFSLYVKLPGNIHPLEGDRKNQFACSLTANYRLVFEVTDDEGSIPTTENNEIDYKQITTIIITEITDYH